MNLSSKEKREIVLRQFNEYVNHEQRRDSHIKSAEEASQMNQDESPEPIAIVGLSGYFPGSQNVETFWQHLDNDFSTIEEIPKNRFDWKSCYDSTGEDPYKMRSKWGGFIPNVEDFDPAFFGLLPSEADAIDPQQRLLLMSVWHTIENAAYPAESLKASRTGVFIGVEENEYLKNLLEIDKSRSSEFNQASSMIANRISYFFDFRGPSEFVNTMCSGAAVAIHRAVTALRAGEIDQAIVGAANIILRPDLYIGLTRMNMLSTTNSVKSFGKDADGFVRAEGVASVMLKSLSQAEKDHDSIYAVIKNVALNYNGQGGMSIAALNKESHVDLIKTCYREASIDPRDVGYIEAQGMGNQAADVVEWNAINTALKQLCDDKKLKFEPGFCRVSTLKPLTGHMHATSALGALFKIIRAFQTAEVHKIVDFKEINPYLETSQTPCRLLTENEVWKSNKTSRLAGLHSYGSGGNNAHILIEEYVNTDLTKVESPGNGIEQLLLISAKSIHARKANIKSLVEYITNNSEVDLEQLAYTLRTGRDTMMYRTAFIVGSRDDFLKKANQYLRDEHVPIGVYEGTIDDTKELLSKSSKNETIDQARKWFVTGNNQAIANHWVNSGAIDTLLLSNRKPIQKLRIPGYSFDLQRCWITAEEANLPPGIETQEEINIIHPFLGMNLSTIERQLFVSTFTGNEFFLTDHQLKGNAVFPGVGYLEMALAAGKNSVDQPIKGLTNIIWQKPLIVSNSKVKVQIELVANDNSMSFEITSVNDADNSTTVHGQGEICFGSIKKSRSLDLKSIQPRLTKRFNTSTLYPLLDTCGNCYGPSFQGIETLWLGKEEALAKIILPPDIRDSQSSFYLHPSVLDSALQPLLAFYCSDSRTSNGNKTYLPFALDEIRIYDHLPGAGYSYVRFCDGFSKDDDVIKADIDFCDNDGNIIVTIRGLTAREIRHENEELPGIEIAKQAAGGRLEYTVASWQPVPIQETIDLSTEIDEVIRFNLSTTDIIPNAKKFEIGLLKNNAEILQLIILDLITFLRSNLQDYRTNYLLEFWADESVSESIFRGITGFIYTIQKEFKHIRGKCIYIKKGLDSTQSLSSEQLIAISRKEQTFSLRDVEVCYDTDGTRWCRGMKTIDQLQSRNRMTKGGTYWIVGGGDLGNQFANFLVTKEHAKVIISSRSLKSSKDNDSIRYIPMDVTSELEVQAVIDCLAKEGVNLSGVFFTVGQMVSNSIIEKDAYEVGSVILPKCLGALNLLENIGSLSTSFVVLFSSEAAQKGLRLSADYAAANAFLDGISESHSYAFRVISINWPMWQNFADKLSALEREIWKRAENALPLSIDLGFEALQNIVNSNVEHIGVQYRPVASEHENVNDTLTSHHDMTQSSDEFYDVAAGFLRSILSESLRVSEDCLEMDLSISDLGFDSITVLDLSKKMATLHRIKLKPTLFFECKTLHDLVTVIAQKYQENVKAPVLNSPSKLNNNSVLDSRTKSKKTTWDSGRKSKIIDSVQREDESRSDNDSIAIIGVAGVYPGAKDLDEFWENIKTGRDCVTEIPKTRWDFEDYFDEDRTKRNKSHAKWGGFIDDVEMFDPLFFNISPKEAATMDPQQRQFLQVVWKTIEDSGYTPENLVKPGLPRNIGVYVGVISGAYEHLALNNWGDDDWFMAESTFSFVANRISYFLDFTGPSIAVDTACSASLTALHLACDSIKTGQASMAIAGGVHLILHPSRYIKLSNGMFLSPTGKCQSFGEEANGMIPGEGVGAVLLKPLHRALDDGDHIYATIKGTSINHGGKSNGFTVPDPNRQGELILEGIKKAEIDARTISYVEAHGTGTFLGDPIEISGLSKAFSTTNNDHSSPDTNTKQYCAIGSVKSNIGHLEGAAGIAGLTKILLQMKYEQLAPSLHSETLNPNIAFDETPFYVQQKLSPWQRPRIDIGLGQQEFPLRAGLSSFGAGGSNVHVILEEHVDNRVRVHPSVDERGLLKIFLFSAMSEAQLHETLQAFKNFLQAHTETGKSEVMTLDNVAYTLQVGRVAMEYRCAVYAGSREELLHCLKIFLENKDDANGNLFHGHVKKRKSGAFDANDNSAHVQKLISDGNHKTLMREWIEGFPVNWSLFYDSGKHQRLSLPTYPFAKERCWLPENADNSNFSARHRARLSNKQDENVRFSASLRSLKDSQNSAVGIMQLVRKFYASEFFVRDHRVNNELILPGVAYLELARAAAEINVAGGKLIRIKDMVWLEPLRFVGESQEVTIRLDKNTNSLDFQIYTQCEDSVTIHGKGHLELKTGHYEDDSLGHQKNLSEIRQRCILQFSGNEHYQRSEMMGIHFGPTLQTIQEIHANQTEALACLELPADCEKDFRQFGLHPSLLDGSLQTVAALDIGPEKSLLLPFSVEEIEIFKPISRQCFAHAELVSGNGASKNSDLQIFNITVVNQDGKPLIRFHKFAFRRVKAEGENRGQSSSSYAETLYFCPNWTRSAINVNAENHEAEHCQRPNSVLILDDNDTFYKNYLQHVNGSNVASDGVAVSLVKIGREFRRVSDSVFTIHPLKEADYQSLFNQLSQDGRIPEQIICFWSHSLKPIDFNKTKRVGLQHQVLNNHLNRGIYAIYLLSRALIKNRPIAPIQILYVYPDSSVAPQLQHRMLSGYAETAIEENPNLQMRLIALFENAKDHILSIVFDEYKRRTVPEANVRYRDCERFIQAFTEVSPSDFHPPSCLKQNGVYLISGGLGGLGRLLSEYLVERVQARLVLIGRSEPTEEGQLWLNILENKGTDILYLGADITRYSDTKGALKKGREHFGSIDGVFHCAGVIEDEFILNKSIDSTARVLASKVYGTLNLDLATVDLPLDFFIMYSSLASILGNTGQADYASANCFVDEFADYREHLRANGHRSGRSIAINWPHWEDGGFKSSQQSISRWHEQIGLMSLTTSEGLAILDKVLEYASTRLIPIYGDPVKIRRKFEQLNQVELKTLSADIPISDNNVDRVEGDIDTTVLGERIEGYLKRIIANELQMSAKRIDSQESLTKYGIESVLALNLIEKLERDVGQLSKTLFFEYQSVDDLTGYFVNNHANKFSELLGINPNRHVVNQLVKNDEFSEPTTPANTLRETSVPGDFLELTSGNHNQRDIAIIGLGGRYPMANNLEEFWKNLESGQNCISEIPNDRWDHGPYFDADKNNEEKNHSKWGGYINDIDKFDPLFFGISPSAAELMDPQERLFLEIVWHCLEDAGYTRHELARLAANLGKEVAVFVGSMYSQYSDVDGDQFLRSVASNSSYWSIANRISHFFNFQGPSMAVDTACASSLSAIHLACESIRSGECFAAIAGGVNLTLHPSKYQALSEVGMLGTGDKSKSFGDGDGYIPGEGVGAVFLKSLNDAHRDEDRIYAVIKASSINHDGKTGAFTVPNPEAQAKLIFNALGKANIHPRTISYIEAAANGSAIGDPIEVTGVKKAFERYTSDKQFCAIGSVKSNLGHLEAASGIAQLTKVCLQYMHESLVPSINAEPLNPNLNLENSPIFIQKTLTKWNRPRVKIDGKIQEFLRRSTVSSFGAGGANAHVILEEYAEKGSGVRVQVSEIGKEKPVLIVLSAKNKGRLKEVAKNLQTFLTDHSSPITPRLSSPKFDNLQNLAYTLQVGREALEERLAIITDNKDELIDKLNHFLNDNIDIDNLFMGNFQSESSMTKIATGGNLGREFVKTALNANALTNLAALWVGGVTVDWTLLKRENKLNRISLPLYPFERKRCWFPPAENTPHKFAGNAHISVNTAPTRLSSDDSTNNEIQSINAKLRHDLIHAAATLLKMDVKEIDSARALLDYGVESIAMTRLRNTIIKLYRVDLPRDTIVDATLSIRKLVDTIMGYIPEDFDIANANENVDHDKSKFEKIDGEKARVPLETAVKTRPAGPLQYALWFMDRLTPQSALYTMPLQLRFTGKLNTTYLESSINAVITRHESLRTIFKSNKTELNQVISPPENTPLEILDIRSQYMSNGEDIVEKTLSKHRETPFLLADGPLVRPLLVRYKDDEYILGITVHHIVGDAWSMVLLTHEILESYAAYAEQRSPELPILPVQYGAYISSHILAKSTRDIQISYWKDQLRGIDTTPILPSDYPRPQQQTFNGRTIQFTLGEELAADLRRLSKEKKVTLNVLLTAAFKTFIHLYTAKTDISIGSPYANRNHPDIENVIGYFANVLVLRTQIRSEMTCMAVIDKVQATLTAAHRNTDIMFPELVDAITSTKDVGSNPLYQIFFVLQSFPIVLDDIGDLSVEYDLTSTDTAKWDLGVHAFTTGPTLTLMWEYNTDLFKGATVEHMHAGYERVLSAFIEGFGNDIASIKLPDRQPVPLNHNASQVATRMSNTDIGNKLLSLSFIKNCTVCVRESQKKTTRIAYIVPNAPFSEQKIYENLRAELSSGNIPDALVFVNQLPLSTEGAIDNKALDELPVINSTVKEDLERQVTQISNVEEVAAITTNTSRTSSHVHLSELLPDWQYDIADQSAIDKSSNVNNQIEQEGILLQGSQPQPLAISDGGELVLPKHSAKTMTEALLQTVKMYSDKGIVYIESDGDESFQSYKDLLVEAKIILAGLQAKGFQVHDKVILQIDSLRDHFSTFWACVLGGFIPVTVAVAPTYNEENSVVKKLVNIWNLLDKPPIITSRHLVDGISNLQQLIKTKHNIYAIDELKTLAASTDINDAKPDDIVFFQLTSGSTGVPKCIQETHSGIINHIHGAQQVNNYSHDDIDLNWLPVDHVVPILTCHLKDVYLGIQQIQIKTQIVLANPLRWLDLMEKFKASLTWAPNFGYKLVNDSISRSKQDRTWDLRSVRYFLNAGEQVTPPVISEFIRHLKPFGVSEKLMQPSFGMAEACTCMTFRNNFDSESGCFRVLKGSLPGPLRRSQNGSINTLSFVDLGPPVPGVVIRITNNDNQVLPEGIIGRFQIKGDVITPGYYKNVEANQEAFVGDGWFNSGDLGFILDGRLALTGREKEMIIVRGANFYCYEIEEIVNNISGVEPTFAAATSVQDDATGTEGLAIFFVGKSHSNEDNVGLIKTIRKNLATEIGLSPLFVIPLLKSSFPKTTSGKIQRSQLKNLLASGHFSETVRNYDVLLKNDNTLPDWFYQRTWIRKSLPKSTVLNAVPTLLFIDRQEVGHILGKTLADHGTEIVNVKQGEKFRRINKHSYVINPENADDYTKLFSLLKKDQIVIQRILHCWTCYPYVGEVLDVKTLENSQNLGLYSLLWITQGLNEIQGDSQAVRILIVANACQAVRDEEAIAYEKTPLLGLLKTIKQELVWIECQHIDIEPDATAGVADSVLSEFVSPVQDLEIAYRNQKRFISVLQKCKFTKTKTTELPFQHGAFYVITGGLGGIGYVVAQFLLEHYSANLLLVGRTELPDRSSWKDHVDGTSDVSESIQKIINLERLGGQIAYMAVDITDAKKLQEIVKDTQSQWKNPLAGIIHLAGNYHEQSILKENKENIGTILSPKIAGTCALYQLMASNKDCIFIGFSSVNGYFGGFNVAGYAAANRFLDSFVEHHIHQSKKRFFSYAWSLWDETGISKGFHAKDLSQARGYQTISVRQGLNSFLGCLNSGIQQSWIGLDADGSGVQPFINDTPTPLQEIQVFYTSNGHELETDVNAVEIFDEFGNQIQYVSTKLNQMPHDESGKINRAELQTLSSDKDPSKAIKPKTDIERQIADIVREILDVDTISVTDNFFELGGNSLNAVQVLDELNRVFKTKLELVDIFKYPSIKRLAEHFASSTGKQLDIGDVQENKRVFTIGATSSTTTVQTDEQEQGNGSYADTKELRRQWRRQRRRVN